MKKKDLYSVAEAAQRLGVGHRRVGQFINGGRLKAFKLGSQWAIPHDELMRFKKIQRLPGAPGHLDA